jgi:tetratricopeptide (TPR) repeat protein
MHNRAIPPYCGRSWSVWIALLVVAILTAPSLAQDAAAAPLRHAAQFLSAGNLDRAEGELQAVLRTFPGEYRALDFLGVVRILQHREAEAGTFFRQSIQSKSDFAGAHAHLGLLYLQVNRDTEAIPELQAAIHLDPARADASDALVHIFRQHAKEAGSNGDPKQALGLLIQARKLAPNNPDVEFEFASAAFQMSLLQDAADGFRKTLTERKDDPLAVYGLGRAYGGLGKLEEARQQFVHYIALRPDDPSGYCSLGITLVALERPEEARAQFARSIKLAPEQAEAYFRLGKLELDANNLDLATTDLQHVLDRDPRHAGALSAMGRSDFMLKHYGPAVELLQRAVASDGSLLEAHYYLGLTYGRLGQKAESDAELQKATQLQQEETDKRKALWNKLDLPAAASQEQQPR